MIQFPYLRQKCSWLALAIGVALVLLWKVSVAEAAEPFTVVMLPDTQYYARSHPEQFVAQTEWIVEQAETRNIRYVTHVGDIVEHGGQGSERNLREWQHAVAAMDVLSSKLPNLPYGVVLGNHDLDQVNKQDAATQFVRFFGAKRYADEGWYVRSSEDEYNHAQMFEAGGRRFLCLSLEWRPRETSLTWAKQVLANNPDMPTILTTHEYTRPGGKRAATGQHIFEKLVNKTPQIFLVLSGHIIGEGHQVVENAAGSQVIEVLADYQRRSNGGDGWLRIMKFDEEAGHISFRTYSPTLKKWEEDSNSMFEVEVDFEDRFGQLRD